VVATVDARLGEASIGNQRDAGSDIALTGSIGPEDSDDRLMLRVDAGLGSVHVHRHYGWVPEPHPHSRGERSRRNDTRDDQRGRDR